MRLRLISFGVALAVALLVVCELALRLWAPDSGVEIRQFVATSLYHLAPCALVEERGDGPHLVANRSAGIRAFGYPMTRTHAVHRIAVAGESSATMLGQEISPLLERISAPLRPQLIDCSGAGSALEHVQKRTREVLRYEPDTLVVVFGHNLTMVYPTDERRLKWLVRAYRSRLLSAATSRANRRIAPEPVPTARRLVQLEAWLEDLVGETGRRGIELVLATSVANLWMPPRFTLAEIFAARFLAARYDHAIGETGRAARSLSALVAQDGAALWHFVLGDWLAARGEIDAAAAHLRAAVDGRQVPRDVAPSMVNGLVRSYEQHQHVRILDMEREVATVARDHLPGWEEMADHCHLRQPLFAREAARLLGTILDPETSGGLGATVGVPSVDDPAVRGVLDGATRVLRSQRGAEAQRWSYGLAIAVERWLRAEPETTRKAIEVFLGGESLADVRDSVQRAFLLAGLAGGYWRAGDRAAARRINDVARREPHAEPWVQLGLFDLGDRDLDGARASFERALELDAAREDARYFAGRVAAGADF